MDVQAYLTMQIADLEAQSALNLSHADKLRAELGNRDNSNRRMEKKIVRDPNKPKRAATAYLLFGKQLRVKKAKKIKAMSPRDVMKYIGEQWKKCPAAAKVELETQASELKRKHIVDLAKYDVDARSGDAVSASTNAKQQKKKRRKNSSDC